jgi:hypothetical protein
MADLEKVPSIFINEDNVDYKSKPGIPLPPSPSCEPDDRPVAVIALAHSPTPPPTNSPTATHTNTPTPTPTLTQTPTNTTTTTQTPTNTTSTTATVTPSTTVQTPTPTASQTATPFSTPSQTPTQTSTPIPTSTPTQSLTQSVTPTATYTTTPSPTPTRGCVEGESFAETTLSAQLSWSNLAYDESRFLIMDKEGTYLYSNNIFLSDSNISSMPLTGPGLWNDLIYHNSNFIAIGKDNVATSTDGISWNLTQGLPTSENTTYSWNKILYVEELGQKYFLLPTVENQQNLTPAPLTYSNNLNEWESLSLPVVYTSGTENRSRNYLSGAYGNGVFVLGSDSKEKDSNPLDRYNPTILSSTNGITWTPRQLMTPYDYEDTFNVLGNVQDIYFNGLEFVAMVVGSRDESGAAVPCARIFHSYNGINWHFTLTIDSNSFAMAYGTTNVFNGGKFLIIANNSFTDLSTIYYSLDGLWWITVGQISTSLGINKIKAIGDSFYAVNNANFYISVDCDNGISF